MDYKLHASLDAASHRIHGRGQIVLHNHSRAALRELYFHLYLNAFKHSRTLFYRVPEVHARSGKRPEQWGWVQVHSLRAQPGDQELWPANAHSPGDPEDETDIAVPLAQALDPGQQLTLEIEWTAQLPSLVERTGFADDFHFVAQWFPKLAKLEPDGSFAHFAFHPHGEFYSNYGRYDVTLETDVDWVVASSGQLQETQQNGGRTLRRFLLEPAHDFTWTAWPKFQLRREQIAGVDVHVYYPPGHTHNTERCLAALRVALPFFQHHYGAYPYPTLSVVHPPQKGTEAWGMEYPGLITTGGPWYTAWLSHGIEQVTLHELAHQWFYGLLGSNEAAWPFLDEGFTSFAEQQAASELFGKGSGYSLLGLQVEAVAYYRLLGVQRAGALPIATAAADFPNFGSMTSVVYGRTATLLETLSRVYGARFQTALSAYTQRYRFAHPAPQDWLKVMHEHLGAAEAEQLRAALFDNAGLDYAVQELQQVSSQGASGLHTYRLTLSRRGVLRWPVEVRVVDNRGGSQSFTWDGQGTEHQILVQSHVPLDSAVLDPERKLLLDENLRNNVLPAAQSVVAEHPAQPPSSPPVAASRTAAVRAWGVLFAQALLWVFGA